MGSKSPLAAGIRSLLLPGWGQKALGFHATGGVLLVLNGMVALVALTAYMFAGPVAMIAWLADPGQLMVVVMANFVYLIARLASAGHAFAHGIGTRRVATMYSIAVVVAIPHMMFGWLGIQTHQALEAIFPTAAAVEAPPVDETGLPVMAASTTTTTTRLELSPIVSLPGQDDQEVDGVVKTEGWAPFGTDRLNVLILGGDAGPGRAGLRTDTMIVASVDPITGDAALIGIPRNFGGFALTDGTPFPGRRLNHVYRWGQTQPQRYPGPDPGALATVDAVQSITGLGVDHYVLVDLTGFAELIDAFGGVTLAVPEAVDGPLYDVETGGYEMVTIEAGTQHMDGAHALAYARSRYGSSDYSRMTRQRCILGTMVRDADFLSLLGRLDDLLLVIQNNVTTDIPATSLPELIQLLPGVQAGSIRSLGLDATWASGLTADGHPIPDAERIRAAVANLISSRSQVDQSVQTAIEVCN